MERLCRSSHCTCPAADESDYCSARCAAAALQAIPPAACDCGHPECQGGGRPEATNPAPRQ